MTVRLLSYAFFICTSLFFTSMRPDINDNRFIPFISHHPFAIADEHPSCLAIETWFAGASTGYDQFRQEIQIPALFGRYDLKDIAESFVAIGEENPLEITLQNKELPWIIRGKLQAQGLWLRYHQEITPHISCGTNIIFMRAHNRHRFFLDKTTGLTPDQLDQTRSERRRLHQLLGLRSGDHAEQTGIMDIDIYGQIQTTHKHAFKFRKIEHGLRFGFLIPTGERKDPNKPASIPFGGDGHPGVYVGYNGIFELKEDWTVGIYAQCTKRLKRTQTFRVATKKEPSIFGPIVDCFCVNPDATFSFSPYLTLENIRDGLGVHIRYTLRKHGKDTWSDARANKIIPINLLTPRKQSEWSSDYFTLGVFYDFGKVKPIRELEPTVTFSWDIPSSLFTTKGVLKTHTISLGIELNF